MKATLNANELMKNVTLTFTLDGVKRLVWRIRLATLLFRLGGWIVGTNVRVEKTRAWDDYPEDDALCESCGHAIRIGDKYTVTTDGCYLCEAHAPSFQDCADYWKDRENLDAEELNMILDANSALRAHVAAGGSPDDKPLSVMA